MDVRIKTIPNGSLLPPHLFFLAAGHCLGARGWYPWSPVPLHTLPYAARTAIATRRNCQLTGALPRNVDALCKVGCALPPGRWPHAEAGATHAGLLLVSLSRVVFPISVV